MSLEPLLSGAVRPGRFRFAGPVSLSSLRSELTRAGWAGGLVDGRWMSDRNGVFDQFSAALEFPSWFGRNWDAFADCLKDLSWLPAPGYVVLWRRGAMGDRSATATAGEIIDDAIEERVTIGLPPLYLVYAGSRRGPSDDAASRLLPVR
jgi:RNAse (barnase) inhibitor barstar